jgi:adenosine kinase
VISPSDPGAMVEHSAWCRENGVRFAADPSQQLAILSDEAIASLIEGADLLFGNTYEAALIEAKTGWTAPEVLGRVGTRLTTHGEDGVVIERTGDSPISVSAVPADRIVDPTGVGDAFRSGFLAAQAWGLGLERSAQAGALLATLCIESVGPQEYVVDASDARRRLTDAYGAAAAAEIVDYL